MRFVEWTRTPRLQKRGSANGTSATVRRRLWSCLAVLPALLAPAAAHAAEYYVATAGSDSNAGTLASPFASLQKGHDVAVAGDTVWIRGGTYEVVNGKSETTGFTFSKSGTSATARIKYWAYQGELPVFDFSGLRVSTAKATAGFYVTGNWLHFKGLEIANIPMSGNISSAGVWNVGGSNNTFELLNIHHNSGVGLSIANGTGGHLVLNCDSHDNYDANAAQGDGQNADGFGVHYQSSGPSTILRGCRAWWNSDDGYDLISQETPVIIENSWAMGNGYINAGMARPKDGNGNGFKAGSSKNGVRHVIQNCLAWKNTAAGFYANHSSGGNDWYNNTSYDNGTQYNLLASPPDEPNTTITLTGAKVHKMRNNIGFPDKNTNMNGVDTGFNSWDLRLTPAAADFASVSDSGFMGPRQADGSLPNINYMKLKAGSQMIDKGTNVGLAVVGAGPDLGCFEYGAVVTSGGAGGASGGGTSGAGGSAITPEGGSSSGGAPVIGSGGSVPSGGVSGTSGGAQSASGNGGGGSGSGGTSAGRNAASGASNTSGSGTAGSTPASGGSSLAGGNAEPAASEDSTSGCSYTSRPANTPLSTATLMLMCGAGALALSRRRRRFHGPRGSAGSPLRGR